MLVTCRNKFLLPPQNFSRSFPSAWLLKCKKSRDNALSVSLPTEVFCHLSSQWILLKLLKKCVAYFAAFYGLNMI